MSPHTAGPDGGQYPTLAEVTTSRVGGPARHWVRATSEQEAIDAIRQADEDGQPLLVLGGGSNLLVADEGFDGTVVHLAWEGIERRDTVVAEVEVPAGRPGSREHGHLRQTVVIRLAAGQHWDQAVAWTVEHGLAGLEALSGIPGSAGATPVQNVGAYGADVSQTLLSVRAWDRQAGNIVELSNAELEFGYRDSIIKRSLLTELDRLHAGEDGAGASPRWVVLSVDFALAAAPGAGPDEPGAAVAPVRYAQLAGALGVEEGTYAPLETVRDHVLELRAGKGMVLNPDDHDTWSTGSFFTNPVVPATLRTRLPEGAPAFGAGEDEDGEPLVKLSAAWLIDHAGYAKGFGLPHGPENGRGPDGTGLAGGRASLSTKHTLALTNRGTARTQDLLTIARAVRDGVADAWGITLHPEPVLVGCSL